MKFAMMRSVASVRLAFVLACAAACGADVRPPESAGEEAIRGGEPGQNAPHAVGVALRYTLKGVTDDRPIGTGLLFSDRLVVIHGDVISKEVIALQQRGVLYDAIQPVVWRSRSGGSVELQPGIPIDEQNENIESSVAAPVAGSVKYHPLFGPRQPHDSDASLTSIFRRYTGRSFIFLSDPLPVPPLTVTAMPEVASVARETRETQEAPCRYRAAGYGLGSKLYLLNGGRRPTFAVASLCLDELIAPELSLRRAVSQDDVALTELDRGAPVYDTLSDIRARNVPVGARATDRSRHTIAATAELFGAVVPNPYEGYKHLWDLRSRVYGTVQVLPLRPQLNLIKQAQACLEQEEAIRGGTAHATVSGNACWPWLPGGLLLRCKLEDGCTTYGASDAASAGGETAPVRRYDLQWDITEQPRVTDAYYDEEVPLRDHPVERDTLVRPVLDEQELLNQTWVAGSAGDVVVVEVAGRHRLVMYDPAMWELVFVG